jgi:hypothetical protein
MIYLECAIPPTAASAVASTGVTPLLYDKSALLSVQLGIGVGGTAPA